MTSRVGSVLVVHAHPDDETLATGGLLAAWAASGARVTVVTCTRGELGEVIPPALAHLAGDGVALAAYREGELAAALDALGVTDHLYLDEVAPDQGPPGAGLRPGWQPVGGSRVRYSDSGMAWAGVGRAGRLEDLPRDAFVAVPLDAAARRLERVLRAVRPDVVVTYGPGGGYGHPDHVRAHEVTMRALELAATARAPRATGEPTDSGNAFAPYRPLAVLQPAVPEEVLRAAYRALPQVWRDLAAQRADEPEIAVTFPDPAGPLPAVAVRSAAAEVVVDVPEVVDRLVAALAAHATQVHSVGLDRTRVAAGAADPVAGAASTIGYYALSNDVLAPLLSREYYEVLRPPGGASVCWPAGIRPVP